MNDTTTSIDAVDAERNTPKVEIIQNPSDAHYYAIYEIHDERNEQRAALNVVVSTQMRVMQAELWYYEPYRVEESTLAAIYQRAVQLLESDYLDNGLNGSKLRIYRGELLKEEVIHHHNPDPRYQPEPRIRIYPFALGYGALVLVLLIFLLINRTVLRSTPASVATSNDAAVAAVQRSAPAINEAMPAAGSALSVEADEPLPQAETNGLEPSIMADDRLMVGMTVRIRPGYRSFVRSEPGPEAGESLGFLENGATAKLLGGPVWKEGNTDTIVWWYVETATGLHGWTPANTSELTLLEPAE